MRCVYTNFVLSLNRFVHEFIWIFRCDKQIEWEEVHNITNSQKYNKILPKHSKQAIQHHNMNSAHGVSRSTNISDGNNLNIKDKDVRKQKAALANNRSKSNILRKISHNITAKWSAVKKFS